MNTQNFKIGAGDLFIAGDNVGATTQDGVIVTYEPDVHLHLSGKYGSTPVKASLIGKKITIKVTMAEVTATNMSNALAGATVDGGKVKFGGAAGVEIVGKELKLVPFDGSESWVFRKAIPSSSVELAYQAANERVYNVTFTALVDESFPVDENLAYVS